MSRLPISLHIDFVTGFALSHKQGHVCPSPSMILQETLVLSSTDIRPYDWFFGWVILGQCGIRTVPVPVSVVVVFFALLGPLPPPPAGVDGGGENGLKQ